MFERLKALLFGEKLVETKEHPTLGVLCLDDDVSAWRTRVDVEGGSIGFLVGGQREPDEHLLAHAAEIAVSGRAFRVAV